jgi:hypothetical protein
MDLFNTLMAQRNNAMILTLLIILASGGLWLSVRRNPRLTNVAIYAALAIWWLSLLAAFIWQVWTS